MKDDNISKVSAPSLSEREEAGTECSGWTRSGGGSVIKVGGAVVEDPASLAALLDQFVKIEGPKVLVHGGGRSATKLAAQLGIESQMVGGRRITDAETLRIVTMVYAGLVNKNIVAQLQARGVNALGLCGADLNLIRAHRRPVTPEGIDFGFVGDVDSADGQRLRQLLSEGITPVIAPITHDGAGQLLNTNADTIAQTIATALARWGMGNGQWRMDNGQWTARLKETLDPSRMDSGPLGSKRRLTLQECEMGNDKADCQSPSSTVSLTYCFELPGVLRDASDPATLIPHLTKADFRQLVADNVIIGGMIPKLENAFAALSAGVDAVRITNIHDLTGGTVITNT